MATKTKRPLQYALLKPEVFAEMRQRYEHWRTGGFQELDTGMDQLIIKLNSLPGVVTHYSCKGHQSLGSAWWEGFSVVMGLTEDGLDHMRYIWDNLHFLILQEAKLNPVWSLVPRFTRLEFQMLPNAGITSAMGAMEWVPVSVLRLNGAQPPVLQAPFIKMVEQAIDLYLLGQNAEPDDD